MPLLRRFLVPTVLALACVAAPVAAQAQRTGAVSTVQVTRPGILGPLGALGDLWSDVWSGFWTQLNGLAPEGAPASSRAQAVAGPLGAAVSRGLVCDLGCVDRQSSLDPDG